jgi:tRNA modification GTPase
LIAQHRDDPIVAIATASGRGSVGVIRISGQDLASFHVQISGGQPSKPRYANLIGIKDDDGSLIDEAIVIFFKGPHSYTGEDVIEIQGHGGPAVMQLLLQRSLNLGQPLGLRLAEPGEFTLRAFLNNKIDLAQAEAVSDLIEAASSAAVKAAAASLSGVFSKEVDQLAKQVLSVRTLVEATLDFPEEDIDFIEKYQVKSQLVEIEDQLVRTLKISEQSSVLREGLKVVLAGEPNVGKSSLLNAICSQDIAIVTDIAGTTRDRIRESLVIDGLPIAITDTAGLRQTTDEIELMGIERTWQAIAQADLILDIVDASKPLSLIDHWGSRSEVKHKTVLRIFNKCDLLANGGVDMVTCEADICVSAKTGFGLDELKQKILMVAGRQTSEVSPWLGRQRHTEALRLAVTHLKSAIEHVAFNDQVLDLVAEDLRLTHRALGSITGEVTADDLLGQIFSSFCIGK